MLTAKYIFDTYRNKASKQLGQNFLFDPKINKKICSVVGDLSNKTVLEVGPGPGGITLEILNSNIKKLYIIEYDKHWASIWRELAPNFDGKLEVIEGDALAFDFTKLKVDIIISNLPYNISTQLLFKWLPIIDSYEALVLMFQKEVAQRLYAKPSTKQYGKLSVITQWKANVTKAFDLEPGCFFPAPKVKSTVVKMVPNNVDVGNIKLFNFFSNFLTASFAHRRKMLLKQIIQQYPTVEAILNQYNYANTVRAEEISVQDYTKICNLLYKNK